MQVGQFFAFEPKPAVVYGFGFGKPEPVTVLAEGGQGQAVFVVKACGAEQWVPAARVGVTA